MCMPGYARVCTCVRMCACVCEQDELGEGTEMILQEQ